MKINVAVCDDDVDITGELDTYIMGFSETSQNEIDIEPYNSGEALIESISDNISKYHIYILDIEMDGMDGFQVAEYIRARNRNVLIIFSTSHPEMMQRAFDVLAFQYMVKPLQRDVVFGVMRKAIHYITDTKILFHFSFAKERFSIYTDDICYFEKDRRAVNLYTPNRKYSFNDTIKIVMSKLDPAYFVQTHASYIVNLEWVESYNGQNVILSTGKELPLSRKYDKAFQMSYSKYIMARV